MGFLRKVGRKIKKGVKKLLSTKLGRIAGSIGLYLVMGAAAKSLSGWANSTFGKAASQAGTEVVSREVAGKAITNAATNSEAANIAFNAIETGVKEGTTDLIMKPNLTDAVSDISTQILDPIDTKNLLEIGKQETRIFSDLTFGEKMKQVGTDTVQFVKETFVPEDTGQFISSAAKSALISSLQEEPEVEFSSYNQVQPRPQTTGPQGAYMQEIAPQFMAANNTTKLPNFNQLMQQNMYGTGTPQAMQSVYADVNVLPLPQV